MVTSLHYDLDTDTTLGGNNASDYVISSQKALKAYIDASPNVFIATAGTTTFSEITSALNAGKFIFVKQQIGNDNYYFSLVSMFPTKYIFGAVSQNITARINTISINNNDNWDTLDFVLATESYCDGAWTKSSNTIASSVAFATSPESKSFDVTSYLPNDNNVYEIIIGILGNTGSTSSSSLNFSVSTDLCEKVRICQTQTHTSTTQRSSGNATIPLKTRTIIVTQHNNTISAPTMSLYMYSYRKVR